MKPKITRIQTLIERLISHEHDINIENATDFSVTTNIFSIEDTDIEFITNCTTGYTYCRIDATVVLHFNTESQLYKNIKQFLQEIAMVGYDNNKSVTTK